MRLFLFIFVCCVPMALAQDLGANELLKKASYYKQFGNDSLERQLYFYSLAHQKLEASGTASQRNKVAIEIGDIYRQRQLYGKALEYYLPLVNGQNGNPSERTDFLQRVADTYSEMGKPDEAARYYDQILSRTGYPENIPVLRDIVIAYYRNGNFGKALEYNRRIKTLLEENGEADSRLAAADNNLGYTLSRFDSHDESLAYLESAYANSKDAGKGVRLPILINLGITHYNMGQYDQSVRYLLEALQYADNDTVRAEINQILGVSSYYRNDPYDALAYYTDAERLARKADATRLLSDILLAKAKIYSEQLEYDRALEHYQAHFELSDSLARNTEIERQRLENFQGQLERVNRELDSLAARNRIQQLTIERLELQARARRSDSIRQQNELVQLRQEQQLQRSTIENQELQAQRRKQEIELVNQRLAAIEKEKQVALLQKNEKEQEALLQEERNLKSLLEKDNEINKLELERQKRFRNNLIFGLALLSLVLFGLYYFYRNKKRDHRRITEAYQELEVAQQELVRADERIKELLRQQVSAPVASALISGTGTTGVREQLVALMFLDIRDFTKYAETKRPEDIIRFQNEAFGFMIELVERHGGVVNQLMGDGYMATFGVPEPQGNDCLNAYTAAMAIRGELEKKIAAGRLEPIRIGIGLHAGPVVTGNVGYANRKQFSITGNPVIIAARLEQMNKELGSTLVLSKDLYDRLPEDERPAGAFRKVAVKGRSEPIEVLAM